MLDTDITSAGKHLRIDRATDGGKRWFGVETGEICFRQLSQEDRKLRDFYSYNKNCIPILNIGSLTYPLRMPIEREINT